MLTIGLMSGTSMDGIDAALLDTDGNVVIKELGAESLTYDSDFKILLKAAEKAVREAEGNLEKANANYTQALTAYLKNELNMMSTAVPEKIKSLSAYFHGNDKNEAITLHDVVQRSTELHAEMVKRLLIKTGYKAEQIDVIGYHGQTLFHKPSAKITVQVGDGQRLADLTGITVVNDFRSNDVRNGGQGAPFAPLYHQALAVRDARYPLAVVNCGGIANITVITGEKDKQVIGFDTGPGNALVDRLVKQRTQHKEVMDDKGRHGEKGKVNEEALQLLRKKSVVVDEKNYFTLLPPKSLDSGNLALIPELDKLSLEDACRTLEAFTAETIVNSIDYFKTDPPKFWILAGGGWNNPVILEELRIRLIKKLGTDVKIRTADDDEVGWNSKAMEAQIFAYLAVRSLKGWPISVPGTTCVSEALSGGHAYLPAEKKVSPAIEPFLKDNPAVWKGYRVESQPEAKAACAM